MNVRMWAHPATQANAETLRAARRRARRAGRGRARRGRGRGAGGWPSRRTIVEAVERELSRGDAGATGRATRPRVRRRHAGAARRGALLGNRSSGRMGVAVAEEARRRGAEVTLLAANLAVPAPFGVTVVDTPTAADLEREALARGGRGRHRHGRRGRRLPAGQHRRRRSARRTALRGRSSSSRPPTCSRRSAPARTPQQVIVGFAADGAGAGLERAREKRVAKGADLIVFNDISRVGHRVRHPRERGRARLERRRAARREGAEEPHRRGRAGRGGEDHRGAMSEGARRPKSRRRSCATPSGADVVAARGRRTSSGPCARRTRRSSSACSCLLAEGHVIIEDFPGVGKTVLAKSLARSLHLSFSRLQFTPDLLPSDVTGVNVFNQKTNEFEFRAGPVFANVLLVDEINRASPKTQSALLEAMQECQVTIDGETYATRAPVPRRRDPEPDRVRRARTRCPRRSSTGSRRVSRSATRRSRRRRGCSRSRPPILRWTTSRRWRRARRSSRPSTPPAGCSSRKASTVTSSRSFGTRARARSSRSARARGRASRFSASRRRAPSPAAATSSFPRTFRASRSRSSRTG